MLHFSYRTKDWNLRLPVEPLEQVAAWRTLRGRRPLRLGLGPQFSILQPDHAVDDPADSVIVGDDDDRLVHLLRLLTQ